jgi:cell division protease FtsH
VEKRAKFSLWYFLFLLIGILILESIFFAHPKGREISYSRFLNLVNSDSVKSVVIETNKIYGLLKTNPDSLKKTKTTTASAVKADSLKKAVNQKTVGSAKDSISAAAASSSAAVKKEETPQHSHTPWRLLLGDEKNNYKQLVKRQFTLVPLNDPHLLDVLQAHHVTYRGKLESNFLKNLFYNWIIPFGLLFLIWTFLFRRMGKGQSFLNVGKNNAKIFEADPLQKVTFQDVAGIDEAVDEVKEVVQFLKDPHKFTRLGAKLPKGVLLVGPPGTGKTLLARAVAGEADVPFFHLSGSDFVEMFVGVGAARVRDLFQDAKQKAPCIIFIDELDAVGKNRGHSFPMGGGYDERENTLNQLLVEMDGFNPNIGIVIMGATNRPEVLDSALLRPGRFDRQILVDRPDLNGRIQIFKVHTHDLPLARDVNLKNLAAETPGFVGADIANICNEAALLASRNERKSIQMKDFQEAIERVVAGLEKKNRLINPQERKIVAFHESGHAVIGYFTPGADPVQKVSIVPRGIGALGYTMQTPLEDRYLMTRTELLGKIRGLLGGRAAEEMIFGEVSTGASNDLERATKIARDMLTVYGMSRHLPNISLVTRPTYNFLDQESNISRHSEQLEKTLDDEIMEIISTAYESNLKLLREKKQQLTKLANYLLRKEKIEEKEIKKILGPAKV